jgi:hypothetical protein
MVQFLRHLVSHPPSPLANQKDSPVFSPHANQDVTHLSNLQNNPSISLQNNLSSFRLLNQLSSLQLNQLHNLLNNQLITLCLSHQSNHHGNQYNTP